MKYSRFLLSSQGHYKSQNTFKYNTENAAKRHAHIHMLFPPVLPIQQAYFQNQLFPSTLILLYGSFTSFCECFAYPLVRESR